MNRRVQMTAERLALLRLVLDQPHITPSVATKQMGHAVGGALAELARLGFLRVDATQQISGRGQQAYLITLQGRQALRQPAQAVPAPAPRTDTVAASLRHDAYTCPELGQTCMRPGAYDAFRYPSLIAGQRVWPKGAAA